MPPTDLEQSTPPVPAEPMGRCDPLSCGQGTATHSVPR